MRDLEKLIIALKKKKLTIATAESCSGGYLAYLLTKTSGSSKVFTGGVVVYSLESKNILLKIPKTLLKKTQGVSGEVVVYLAKKVAKILKADIGAAIVGFAGPKTKPGIKPGTIYLAISYKRKTLSKKIVIAGGRDTVRKKASQIALRLISQIINK